MLPLNKPCLNNNFPAFSKGEFNDFIVDYFNAKNYLLNFSARQSLDIIYKRIQNTQGKKTVAVSPLTCVEALIPILDNNHDIEFVDIDPHTLNMDENIIPYGVDVIQAIHFGGSPQNMSIIQEKNASILVEDCAQSFGSEFNDQKLGTFGNFSVFSLIKNTFSIGGSLLIENGSKSQLSSNQFPESSYSLAIYRALKRKLENHSKIHPNLAYLFLNILLKLKPEKTNTLLKNLSPNKLTLDSIYKQFPIVDYLIEKRIKNSEEILSKITNKNIIPQFITPTGKTNYNRLYFLSQIESSKEIITKLRKKGIGANHLTQSTLAPYQERLDKHPILNKFIVKSKLQNYFELHDSIFCIPNSPALTDYELNYIVKIINSKLL